jgi:PAS domain S-box-containing protein
MQKDAYIFHKLKGFATYILHDRLNEFTEDYIKELITLNTSLLKFLSDVPEGMLFPFFKERISQFFLNITKNEAFQEIDELMTDWKNDKLPGGIPKYAITPSDPIAIYAARKKSILMFLPEYTADLKDGIEIAAELDDFFIAIQQKVFETYVSIQQELLAETEARFRMFAESSFEAILFMVNGVIFDCNTAALQLFKCKYDQIIGKKLLEFVAPHSAEVAKQLTRNIKGSNEAIGVRIDGSKFPMQILGRKIIYNGKSVKVTAIRDISDLKKKEEEIKAKNIELQRYNEELEQFTYVTSHDMKEPLRMVSNYTQLLAERYTDKLEVDGKEFIGYAVEGVKRMQLIIDGLLEYSNLRQYSAEMELTSLEVILKEAIKNLQPEICESGAKITYDALPTLTVYPKLVCKLFYNLLSNAIKFRSHHNPEINVQVKKKGSNYIIGIQDDGIGFDMAYADRVFAIFKRLNERQRYPGSGIGLAICKKIVELHDGSIWADSKPESGTTFYFSIPETVK